MRQGGGEWLRLWKRRAWALRVLRGRSRTWAWRRLLESRAQREARLAAATLSSTGRLVFVCHGNIMRSAFATQVARAHVPAAAARIVGAGTHATAGRSAQDAALEVSRTMALPLDGHAATPLHALSLTGSDVVVCMDALNEANVLASYPALAPRVFRVGDVGASGETPAAQLSHADREIVDPYGRGIPATRDAFERVAGLARRWAERLPV
ncbi:arsenate reductase/protein-tyrosine-phosphatase family protein [Gemmatimonas sp.]